MIRLLILLGMLLDTNVFLPKDLPPWNDQESCEYLHYNRICNDLARTLDLSLYDDDENFNLCMVSTTLAWRWKIKRTCPPSLALDNFSAYIDQVKELIAFSDRYIQFMKGLANLERREDRIQELTLWIQELEERNEVWCNLRRCYWNKENKFDLMEQLGYLQKKLGFKDFWEGRMIDIIPWECFRSIDP